MKTVGRVTIIKVPHTVQRRLYDRAARQSLNLCWYSGTAYNYGIGEPNYPVPATYNTPTNCVVRHNCVVWFNDLRITKVVD